MPQPSAFASEPAQPRVQESIRKRVQEEMREEVQEEMNENLHVQVKVKMREDTLDVHERRQTQPAASAVAPPACPVEDIARAYLLTSAGDADLALRCVIADALSDLLAADRRARERSLLILRGYVRGRDG